MRKGQGVLVVTAIVFILLAAFTIGIYIKLTASIMDVSEALKKLYMRKSLKLEERLRVDVFRYNLQGTSLVVRLRIASNSSIPTMIEYVLLTCYTGSGFAKDVIGPLQQCRVTLPPGAIRNCIIRYELPRGCSYVVVTLVTALGNSYSVRVG